MRVTVFNCESVTRIALSRAPVLGTLTVVQVHGYWLFLTCSGMCACPTQVWRKKRDSLVRCSAATARSEGKISKVCI